MEDPLPSWICRVAGAPGEVEAALDDGGAWTGGTALALTGTLPPAREAEWALWTASLPLTGTTGADEPVARLHVTGADPAPWLTLWFADRGPERVPLALTPVADTLWSTAEAGLGQFAGRTITRIGLGLANAAGAPAGVDLRVGALTVARRSQLVPPGLVTPAVGVASAEALFALPDGAGAVTSYVIQPLNAAGVGAVLDAAIINLLRISF
jgi:hypothetical protein